MGGENIQVFLRMRPLNSREIAEEHAVSAWKIVDNQSITMDSHVLSSGSRFVVPAGAYASLLAPTSGGQAKAYTFSKFHYPTYSRVDGCFNMDQRNTEVY